MLHRVRARVRYPASSGLAGWSHAQMDVRYGQAVHIREGEPAEEAPVNEVVDDGDYQVFRCDLPLMDEAAAIDAFATLTTASVWGEALTLDPVDGDPSWIERHECDHDEDDRSGCIVMDRVETADPDAEEWQAGVAYAVDDEVTYDGTLYRCVQAHTSQAGWEPPNVPALWGVVE